MDIKMLKNFLLVARQLSFTKAADLAFASQSAISKQIRQLEQELSAELFTRNKRTVELTPAGKYFQAEVTELINQWQYIAERTNEIHSGEAGEIKIGYTHSAMQSFLPSLIYELNRRFPNLKTTLLEMTNTHQSKALRAREIDLSFSPNPIIEKGLRSKVVISDNFGLILPINHPYTKKKQKHLSDLAGESFILPPKTEGTLYVSILESICTEAGFSPHVVHETPYANTGIRLVQAGIGITIEPIYGVSGYTNIKVIELTEINQKAELTMLWLPEFETTFPHILQLLHSFRYT